MLLPYRIDDYRFRGSRVVAEAMANAIPMVVTRGTTLADQANEFGAAVECASGDVGSLSQAIEVAQRTYSQLASRAKAAAPQRARISRCGVFGNVSVHRRLELYTHGEHAWL